MRTHEKALVRAARADVPSGWEAQWKVRALAALAELGSASPLDEDELRHCSRTWQTIRRRVHAAPQASLAAAQELERLDVPLDGGAEAVRRLFDDRPDTELVAPDDLHPTVAPWLELDACHTLGKRRRWFCRPDFWKMPRTSADETRPADRR